MSARIKQLAEAQGFGAEFGALQRLRVGRGDPAPDDLLQLPRVFRTRVLGLAGADDAELSKGRQRLIELVQAAPHRERELLQMAFNFDSKFGTGLWTSRVADFALRNGSDERKIRERVDTAILQLLIRTREAAEQFPEPFERQMSPTSAADATSGLTAAAFLDQDYVRSSRAFVDAWREASTVDMCGFGHNRMLVSYSAEIIQVLRAGGRLRVLLQDPEGRAVIDANYRSSTPKASNDAIRHQHRAGLATLASLQASAMGPGDLLVRSYDIMPPFTAYFFDAEAEGRAKAFIWFWSWRQSSSQRPGFAIRRDVDRLWFDRFYSQFLAMWTDDDVSSALEIA